MTPVLEFPSDASVRGQILFFLVYRMHKESNLPGGAHIWKPIYKSEIKAQTNNRQKLEFVFNQLSLLKSDVCASLDDREVKVEFFISSKNGRHKNIGSVLFTVNDLKEQMQGTRLPIVKQKDAFLAFQKLEIKKRNSFLEYIFGGCEINLAIAVDFTLSNGKPEERGSLHDQRLE